MSKYLNDITFSNLYGFGTERVLSLGDMKGHVHSWRKLFL